MTEILGRISSEESMGLVDGPGIRYVVFLQGCMLRCKYCHNPETWDINGKCQMVSANDLVAKIERYKSYFSFISKQIFPVTCFKIYKEVFLCFAQLHPVH